jgi:radical SAM-linked protein
MEVFSPVLPQKPVNVFWRYRLQFSKMGLACYLSHHDLIRTFTRAIRRARLPVALTQGFNPHLDLSYGPPLPVGIAGEKEYLDLNLIRALSPASICSLLNKVLPEGLRVNKAWLMPKRSKDSSSLVTLICQATYLARIPLAEEIEAVELANYIRDFLAADEIVILRLIKPKKKSKEKEEKEKKQNIRPGIFSLKGQVKAKEMLLEMKLSLGSKGNVRPEQVLRVFLANFPAQVDLAEVKIIRTELGPPELLTP